MSESSPLGGLCSLWIEKIRHAEKHKKEVFGEDAAEAMRFYKPEGGGYAFIYKGDKDGRYGVGLDVPEPTFKMTFNKVAELVQIFGPILYNRNPIRIVTPRRSAAVDPQVVMDPVILPMLSAGMPPQLMQDPAQSQMMGQLMAQAMLQKEDATLKVDNLKSKLIEDYLNFTPNELDLKGHAGRAIDEALIKGRGCLAGATEVYARTERGDGPVRVRDLHDQKGEAFLWDGERWNRVIGTREIDKSDDDLQITLQCGEVITCTADHIWPTERGNRHADQLVVGDVLKRVVLPEPDDPEDPEYVPDEVGWFVGLFLGDGSLAKDRNGRIHIAGHIAAEEIRDRVQELVAKYGGKVRVTMQEGTKKCNMTISSPILVAIVREFLASPEEGAYRKHLSTRCWKRSNVFLRNLLQGYLDADGHLLSNKQTTWRLGFCNNKELANDLRILCGRLGFPIRLKLYSHKNGLGVDNYENYRGEIWFEGLPGHVKNRQEIVDISKANWRCDKFYDIAVENSPHTYALASGLLTHNCLWTCLYTPPNSPTKFVGSFFESVDFLLVDPDAEEFDKAWWIARKVVEPIWECERKFHMEPGTLKRRGNAESSAFSVEVDTYGKHHDRARGLTNDLIVYYEIYSRMGVGGRLSGGSKEQMNQSGLLPTDLDEFSELLDPIVGEYVYLCVAPNVDFPLNLPPEMQDLPLEEDPLTGEPPAGPPVIKQQLSWPIPFWSDGKWPVTVLDFHPVPRCSWPISHIKPAMGELRALNWLYSFMVGKCQVTLRTLVAVLKELSEEFKTQVLEGADLTMIELDTQNRSIAECVQVLQYPQMNADIWKIIESIEASFEKRVGLNEIFYGTSKTALRSATEADMKSQHLNIRPDDMSDRVESWMTEAARKEAMTARLLLSPQDIEPILGPTAAMLWSQVVLTSDPVTVARELDYRVESGSARKPNRERDIANSNDSVQVMLPILNQFAAATGQTGPLNALLTFWAKVRDLDPAPFLLPPPPPPMPAPPPAGAGGEAPPPEGKAPPQSGGPAGD